MSCAALNKASRVFLVKPFAQTCLRARSRRSHSSSIQDENWPEICVSAASARPTGSSGGSVSLTVNTARRSLFGGLITSWSAKVATEGCGSLFFCMTRSCSVSARDLCFVEQGSLSDDVGAAAFGALRPDVIGIDVAPPVAAQIALGLDEGARITDHIEDALIERLGRDRLGHEFGDAGVACRHHAPLLGMAGEHDDRHIGVRVGARLADHLRKLKAVEDRHRP